MKAIGELVLFEPDRVELTVDAERLALKPGQTVVSHGIDRNLDIGEACALTVVVQERPNDLPSVHQRRVDMSVRRVQRRPRRSVSGHRTR
jgi:hypothetical protein